MTHTKAGLVASMLGLVLLACTDDPGADTSEGSDTSESADTSENADTNEDTEMGTPGICVSYPTADAMPEVFVRNGAIVGDPCTLNVTPCGGDAAGVWTFGSTCGPELVDPGNPFEEQCPGGNYTFMAARRTGTLAVSTNGNWELVTSNVMDFTFQAFIDCLAFDCGVDAEEAITANGGSATCTGPINACDCTVTDFPFETTTRSGTLGTGGTTLDPDENPNPMPYCIDGDALTLWTLIGSASSSGEACESDGDCSTDAEQVGVCTPS